MFDNISETYVNIVSDPAYQTFVVSGSVFSSVLLSYWFFRDLIKNNRKTR